MPKKATWIDYLHVLVRWKRLLFITVLVVGVLGSIYSLLMPKEFKASALIMPPGSSGGMLGGLPVNIPGINLGALLGAGNEQTNIVMAILNSRTVAENTIRKFHLIERYHAKSIEHALLRFKNRVKFSLEKEGTISVEAITATPFFHPDAEEEKARHLCVNMVNYIIQQADSLNRALQTQQARYYRRFIEKRYLENIDSLRSLENRLKAFGEKYGVVALDEQLAASIKMAAEIQGQLLIEQISAEVLKKFVAPDNPEYQKKITKIRALRKQLNDFIGHTTAPDKFKQDIASIFPRFSSAPELGVQYLRLKRELEVQKILYEFLTQQYEQAKIQEAKDTPTVQVLDPPRVPILRYRPKRKLFVLFLILFAGILTVCYIFFMEYVGRLRETEPEAYRKLEFVYNNLMPSFLKKR